MRSGVIGQSTVSKTWNCLGTLEHPQTCHVPAHVVCQLSSEVGLPRRAVGLCRLHHDILSAGRVGHRRCYDFVRLAVEYEIDSSEWAVVDGIRGVAAVGDRV